MKSFSDTPLEYSTRSVRGFSAIKNRIEINLSLNKSDKKLDQRGYVRIKGSRRISKKMGSVFAISMPNLS